MQSISYAGFEAIVTEFLEGKVGDDIVILHIAFAAENATAANDKQGQDIYLIEIGSDGMPADFYPCLKRITGIPMKPEWAKWLWEEGQKETPREFRESCYGETALIEPPKAYGVTAWLIRANRDA